MKYLSLLLITLMLSSCATTAVPPTEADLALRRINAERMKNYTPQHPSNAERLKNEMLQHHSVNPPPPMPSAPPVPPPPLQDSVSGWDVLGAIVLLPLAIPLVLIGSAANSGYRYHGVHCKSYTYKDQYHTKCY